MKTSIYTFTLYWRNYCYKFYIFRICHLEAVFMCKFLNYFISEKCPDDTEAFNGDCYWSPDTETGQEDADTKCFSRGGSLAQFSDEANIAFLSSIW